MSLFLESLKQLKLVLKETSEEEEEELFNEMGEKYDEAFNYYIERDPSTNEKDANDAIDFLIDNANLHPDYLIDLIKASLGEVTEDGYGIRTSPKPIEYLADKLNEADLQNRDKWSRGSDYDDYHREVARYIEKVAEIKNALEKATKKTPKKKVKKAKKKLFKKIGDRIEKEKEEKKKKKAAKKKKTVKKPKIDPKAVEMLARRSDIPDDVIQILLGKKSTEPEPKPLEEPTEESTEEPIEEPSDDEDLDSVSIDDPSDFSDEEASSGPKSKIDVIRDYIGRTPKEKFQKAFDRFNSKNLTVRTRSWYPEGWEDEIKSHIESIIDRLSDAQVSQLYNKYPLEHQKIYPEHVAKFLQKALDDYLSDTVTEAWNKPWTWTSGFNSLKDMKRFLSPDEWEKFKPALVKAMPQLSRHEKNDLFFQVIKKSVESALRYEKLVSDMIGAQGTGLRRFTNRLDDVVPGIADNLNNILFGDDYDEDFTSSDELDSDSGGLLPVDFFDDSDDSELDDVNIDDSELDDPMSSDEEKSEPYSSNLFDSDSGASLVDTDTDPDAWVPEAFSASEEVEKDPEAEESFERAKSYARNGAVYLKEHFRLDLAKQYLAHAVKELFGDTKEYDSSNIKEMLKIIEPVLNVKVDHLMPYIQEELFQIKEHLNIGEDIYFKLNEKNEPAKRMLEVIGKYGFGPSKDIDALIRVWNMADDTIKATLVDQIKYVRQYYNKPPGVIANFFRNLFRESYARAILKNDLIEETRIRSHDYAISALRMHLNQNRGLSNLAIKAAQSYSEYCKMLNNYDLELPRFNGCNTLLETLTQIVYRTDDLLSDVGFNNVFKTKHIMIEEVTKKHIELS